MDDSFTRPGSIPFKWEICPGTPKHTRSASAAAAQSPAPASAKVAPRQLPPPPFMASPSPYCSPRVSYHARSASVSPARCRPAAAQHRRRPTAFLDLAPRAAPVEAAVSEARQEAAAATAAAYRCFPLLLLGRGRRGGKKGRPGSASGSSSSSSGSSFRSDGAGEPGLRRSASSSSSSLPLPPGRRFAEAREEVDAAAGWFF